MLLERVSQFIFFERIEVFRGVLRPNIPIHGAPRPMAQRIGRFWGTMRWAKPIECQFASLGKKKWHEFLSCLWAWDGKGGRGKVKGNKGKFCPLFIKGLYIPF